MFFSVVGVLLFSKILGFVKQTASVFDEDVEMDLIHLAVGCIGSNHENLQNLLNLPRAVKT